MRPALDHIRVITGTERPNLPTCNRVETLSFLSSLPGNIADGEQIEMDGLITGMVTTRSFLARGAPPPARPPSLPPLPAGAIQPITRQPKPSN
jgi:hypothetical protein